MSHQDTEIPFDGYVSQEIDFLALFNRSSQQRQDLINAEVIDPLFDAQSAPGAGKFCHVTILGHADRFDVAGTTPDERRAKELDNSRLRAESAAAFLLDRLNDRLQSAGLSLEADFASTQNASVAVVACGAGDLFNAVPVNEEQRQQNRRVNFVVSSFSP